MIRQNPGDILEIEFEDNWFYLVIITPKYLFGGNIVYAFHGNGERIVNFVADVSIPGFNICTDLLLPKKEGKVSRIGKVASPTSFLVSQYLKTCMEHRIGRLAKEWWIYKIDNPNKPYKKFKVLPKKYHIAMDMSMSSLDLASKKIKKFYKPDQNPFINKNPSFLDYLF